MKAILLITVIGLAITSNSDTKVKPVDILELKYSQTNDLLSDIFSVNKDFYDWERAVFFINVEKDTGAKIAVLYKQNFSWILSGKEDKLYGYFEFNGYPVLVYGDSASHFFSKTNKSKSIPWLKQYKKPKNRKTDPPPPPSIFEPEVWLYKFETEKFIFIQKGMFSIW